MKIFGDGDRLSQATDAQLSDSLRLHLDQIENYPDSSGWSRRSVIEIQDEMNQREKEWLEGNPTTPLADFIWDKRDGI